MAGRPMRRRREAMRRNGLAIDPNAWYVVVFCDFRYDGSDGFYAVPWYGRDFLGKNLPAALKPVKFGSIVGMFPIVITPRHDGCLPEVKATARSVVQELGSYQTDSSPGALDRAKREFLRRFMQTTSCLDVEAWMFLAGTSLEEWAK